MTNYFGTAEVELWLGELHESLEAVVIVLEVDRGDDGPTSGQQS